MGKEFELIISGPKIVHVYQIKDEMKHLMQFTRNPRSYGFEKIPVIEKRAADKLVIALKDIAEDRSQYISSFVAQQALIEYQGEVETPDD